MAEKIELNRVLRALDTKDRGFYDSLTDEEKKSLAPFLMLRYSSSVTAGPDLEHYYLAATNHYANKHFFGINKHPKLQWLSLTAASPGMGTQRHQWIGMKKKEAKSKKKGAVDKRRVLLDMHPAYKVADIDLLEQIVTDDEIKDYLRSIGDDA